MNLLLAIYTNRGDTAYINIDSTRIRKMTLTGCDPDGSIGPMGPSNCHRLRIVHDNEPVDLFISPDPDVTTLAQLDILDHGNIVGHWTFPPDNPMEPLDKLANLIWGKK